MSTSTAGPSPEERRGPPATSARGPRTWLIAGTTFLLGMLLGATILTALGTSGQPTAVPGGSGPTVTAVPGPSAIPATCQRALDRSVAALSTAEAAVDALRHLRTARLQQLLDELEAARREVDTWTARCHRDTAAAG